MSILHDLLMEKATVDILAAVIQEDKSFCTIRDTEGRFPLHIALEHQISYDIIVLLIEAYPNACKGKNKFGDLPIHTATTFQQPYEVIQLLIRAHPRSLRDKHNDDMLPLHLALQNNASEDVIKVLLDEYPDAAQVKSIDGYLPIHQAAASCHSADIVQRLLDAYPEAIYEEDSDGQIPLRIAARNNSSPDVLAVIIRAFPEGCMEMSTFSGATPIHIAITSNNHPEIIAAFLREVPSCVRSIDDTRKLPLHTLLTNIYQYQELEINWFKTLQLLLDADPSTIHEEDVHEISPIDICLERLESRVDIRTQGFILRLLLNADLQGLTIPQQQQLRDLNWISRFTALRVYIHIIERAKDIESRTLSVLMKSPIRVVNIFSRLCQSEGGSSEEVSSGLIRQIVLYL